MKNININYETPSIVYAGRNKKIIKKVTDFEKHKILSNSSERLSYLDRIHDLLKMNSECGNTKRIGIITGYFMSPSQLADELTPDLVISDLYHQDTQSTGNYFLNASNYMTLSDNQESHYLVDERKGDEKVEHANSFVWKSLDSILKDLDKKLF